MDENNTHKQQLLTFFGIWSQSESKIRLYGPDMPQSQQIVKELHAALVDILATVPSFSIVRNANSFDMIVHDATEQCYPVEPSDHTAQAGQVFERFDIHSLTFHRDFSLDELVRFFRGLHMSPNDLKQHQSLAQYVKDQDICHVELDQLRLAPQKKGSTGTQSTREINLAAEQALEDLLQQTSQGLSVTERPTRQKAFASTWEGYLSDQLDAPTFQNQHGNMVSLAQEKPEMFIRALQHMAAKQVKIESFLANLEQKLFDVGFPPGTVEQIMQKLGRPKKVLVDEAELARLRQIEKSYQPDLAERIEQSLAEIDTLQGKLSDERERGDAIIRQSSQGVMVIDADGRIVEVNPVAEKVLGLSPREARGALLQDVVQQHHMLSIVSDWESESDTHTPKHVKIEAGSEETIDTIRESAIVIEDKSGRSIGGVSALQDVVRQKDLEKRKNDILDVLGHDLRAPLNIVKQNIALIADFVGQPDSMPTEKQAEFMDACRRHIDRMEKLINKVLDVRQLETGKIALKMDTMPINKVIEDAAHSLDNWARDKGIEIVINARPLPEIYGDPERIYQVITNFISNALKFTPAGGRIDIGGQALQLEEGDVVEISVADSGIGIREKDLERIFNKYEQVSLERPAGVSGLGLGLSICKTIVEMHHGTLWATSQEGEGSTFIFRLPLAPEDLDDTQA